MGPQKYAIFLHTAEVGNITQAAAELGYTQSAVSRIIADLEAAWGMSLLTRSRTGVVLTSAGAALLPHLRAVCNAQKELEEQVSELHGLTRGTLRLGTMSSVSLHWLPGIMKSFLDRYPNIHFQLMNSMEYAEIEDWVMGGQVDCGFIALPSTQPLETIHLRHDRLLAVLPLDHPLADAPRYPVSRFTEDTVVRVYEDRDQEYVRIFDRLAIKPNVRYSVNDDYVVLAMVSQGLGVSILPELVLRNTPYPVVTKPLDPPYHRDLGLAVRSAASLSPVTARFREHVTTWMAQYSGGVG